MNICGIVAEYNPFHNGHLYHIQKSRELSNAEHIIVVMSGNFVQRGEPALCDKYLRTKAALLGGADIVLELPVYFSTASAESFAYSAITILNKTAICDSICFGSEAGNLDQLYPVAELLANEKTDYKAALNTMLDKGVSYPVARANALSVIIGNNIASVLNEPNNILAIEYLKSIIKTKSRLIPFTIAREKAHYHSTHITDEIASATSIRKLLLDNEIPYAQKHQLLRRVIPTGSIEMLLEHVQKDSINQLDNFSHILHYILRTSQKSNLKAILDINEGFENRILRACNNKSNISDIIADIKTKRYTFTKIQRAILHIILDIRANEHNLFMRSGGPLYIRVLGFKKEKAHLLTNLTQNAQLPVITNLKYTKKILSPKAITMLEKEVQSTDIYNMGLKNNKNINYEYHIPLVII